MGIPQNAIMCSSFYISDTMKKTTTTKKQQQTAKTVTVNMTQYIKFCQYAHFVVGLACVNKTK